MDAQAPFDNPKADVILRSSDNVDFRVFRLLLSLASPIFNDMFAMPQASEKINDNNQEMKDGLPIIQLAEDSQTLSKLLITCYPRYAGDAPELETLEDLQAFLEVATKYEMDEAAGKYAREELVAPRFLEGEAVRVFSIAHRWNLTKEIRIAARATLRNPMPAPFVEELEYISAAAYHRLWTYHRKCAEVAEATLSSLPLMLFTMASRFIWSQCSGCHWWATFRTRISAALRDKPCGATVLDQGAIDAALREANKCSTCRGPAEHDLREFAEMWANDVDAVTSKVIFGCFPSPLFADI
jgi:hypothetical protein